VWPGMAQYRERWPGHRGKTGLWWGLGRCRRLSRCSAPARPARRPGPPPRSGPHGWPAATTPRTGERANGQRPRAPGRRGPTRLTRSRRGRAPPCPRVWLRSPRFFTPYRPTRTRQEPHAPSLNGDRQSSAARDEARIWQVNNMAAAALKCRSLAEPVKSACGVPSGSATPPLDRTRPTLSSIY
jgi:hypothetical protein